MGRIKRQGIGSSISGYIGLVLGFINGAILFPKLLGPEVYGFCQFLIQTGGVIASVSLLGLPAMTIRFFPYFRDRSSRHGGYLSYLLGTGALLTVVTVAILLIAEQHFLNWFDNDQSENYLQTFFWAFIVVVVFLNFSSLLNAYSTALMRPRVPVFLSEVIGRLITLALILVFFATWIDKHTFITLFAFKPAAIFAGLLAFLIVIREFHLRIDIGLFGRKVFREMWTYGSFAMLSQLGNQIINRIDMIMLAAMLTYLDVGIYTVFFFLSTVIIISHHGFSKIISPVIADYWKNNNTVEIQKLYSRTALNNLVIGTLVFAGIIVNLDNAVILLGEEYRAGTQVAIYLGVAQLVHLVNGYNGLIVIHSKLYRYDLIFKIVLVILTILTNYFFIKRYGLTGAAIATAITLVLTNILYQGLLYTHFRMHPFSWKMLYILAIGMGSAYLGSLLPVMPGSFVWDILLRSALIIAVYGSCILLFRISKDANDVFDAILDWVRNIFR